MKRPALSRKLFRNLQSASRLLSEKYTPMILHNKHRLCGLPLLISAMALNGCTHYAPGYDGWTAQQVEKVKDGARQRYLNLGEEDGKLLGVDYLKFNSSGYQIPLKDMDGKMATECESLPYVKYRIIGSVALKTSVCLNEKNEVNRIVYDYVGKNDADINEIVEIVQSELKNKYGHTLTPMLENRFLSKAQYKAMFFSESPAQSDLLHYNSLLISDYVTSATTDWGSSGQRTGHSRFILDFKLRDFSDIQKEAASRRAAGLKNLLNSSE